VEHRAVRSNAAPTFFHGGGLETSRPILSRNYARWSDASLMGPRCTHLYAAPGPDPPAPTLRRCPRRANRPWDNFPRGLPWLPAPSRAISGFYAVSLLDRDPILPIKS